MKTMILAGAVALAAAGAAIADVKIDIPGPLVFLGAQSAKFDSTPLVGTLTGVSVTFTYSGAGPGSWASDIVVGVDNLAWGGFNTTFGLVNMGPLNGIPDSGANGVYSGTGGGANVAYNNQIASILIGNGWTSTTGGATLSDISVTLIGVEKIPAPGAVALLGLAGFISRRRRA